MAKDKVTYYVVYTERLGDILYASFFNEFTGTFDLGDKPYRFIDKDFAVNVASNLNYVLDKQGVAERYGVRRIVEDVTEIAVRYTKPEPQLVREVEIEDEE